MHSGCVRLSFCGSSVLLRRLQQPRLTRSVQTLLPQPPNHANQVALECGLRWSRKAYERLELLAGKLARAVLRGGSGGNIAPLPDPYGVVLEGPFAPHELTMPFQQRVGLEQEDDLTKVGASTVRQCCQFAGENDQGELLPPRNARRVRLLPLEDAQLLAKEQDLNIFVMAGSSKQPDEVEQQ